MTCTQTFLALGLSGVDSLEAGQEIIRHGLAATALRQLARCYDVSLEVTGRLVGIPKATLTRKLRQHDRLGVPEGDRAYTLARLYSCAVDVFDDPDKVRAWFQRPNRALGGAKPFDLLDTQPGLERIQRVLDRIEYGAFS